MYSGINVYNVFFMDRPTNDKSAKLIKYDKNNSVPTLHNYGTFKQRCNRNLTSHSCNEFEYSPECLFTSFDNLDIIGNGSFGTV